MLRFLNLEHFENLKTATVIWKHFAAAASLVIKISDFQGGESASGKNEGKFVMFASYKAFLRRESIS